MWSKGKGKVPIVCLCACAVDFEEPHCKWKEEHYSEPLRSGSSRIPTDLRKELTCSSPQKEKFPLNIYNVLSMGTMPLWVVWMRSLGTWVKLTQSSLPIRAHNPETESTWPKLPSGSKVTLLANGAFVGVVAGRDRIDKPILKVTSARQRETADHVYKAWPWI